MNKTIRKIAVAAVACVALCGTTLASPGHGGGHCGGGAPRHCEGGHHHDPGPMTHGRGGHGGGHHHGGHGERECWTMLGAAAIGGIVGGIVSACR